MGLFRKKTDDDVDLSKEEQFLDETFREELRNHGRWYFERVINENGSLFKRDLDATVAKINEELNKHVREQLDQAITQMNTELKNHVTQQMQAQFDTFTDNMKVAQDATLQLISHSAQDLQKQYQDLSQSVRDNIAEQESMLHTVFEDDKARMVAMGDAQEEAIKSLKSSAQALQEHYQNLTAMLQKDVEDQKAALVGTFEKNMAQVIEQHLLDAIGDTYDLKAQVPGIIKRMEADKQAIVDDIKL